MIDMIAFLWWTVFPSINIRVYQRAAAHVWDHAQSNKAFCQILLKDAWEPCTPREQRFIERRYIEPARISWRRSRMIGTMGFRAADYNHATTCITGGSPTHVYTINIVERPDPVRYDCWSDVFFWDYIAGHDNPKQFRAFRWRPVRRPNWILNWMARVMTHGQK